MTPERDGELPPWALPDERHPERGDEWRALLASLAEAQRERDEWEKRETQALVDGSRMQERAEHAESQLAALRQACVALDAVHATTAQGNYALTSDDRSAVHRRYHQTLADTASAASRVRARIRAEALEEAIADVEDTEFVPDLIDRLRALAAKEQEKPIDK